MIFEYYVEVPLTYNKFSIVTNNPSSEINYRLHNVETDLTIEIKSFDIPGCEEGKHFKNTVTVKLYSRDYLTKNINIDKEEIPKLFCEITGLLVTAEEYAKQVVEEIINRVCKELSLVFIKHNANRQSYQPRVEALWNQAVWRRKEYLPFVEARRKALEKDDGKCKTVVFEDNIYFRDSIYCMIYVDIPSDELPIQEWLRSKDDIVEFLMTEYYSALGTEKIKSKFFHLFSIIEFCEKEYEEHNGAKKIFSDDEVNNITSKISCCIDIGKRKKALSLLKSGLLKCTTIGRAKKLKNILQWMGIEDYSCCGSSQVITTKMLEKIIKVRNKTFHGTKDSEEIINKKYTEIVEMLLYIDERIIDFVKTGNRYEMN